MGRQVESAKSSAEPRLTDQSSLAHLDETVSLRSDVTVEAFLGGQIPIVTLELAVLLQQVNVGLALYLGRGRLAVKATATLVLSHLRATLQAAHEPAAQTIVVVHAALVWHLITTQLGVTREYHALSLRMMTLRCVHSAADKRVERWTWRALNAYGRPHLTLELLEYTRLLSAQLCEQDLLLFTPVLLPRLHAWRLQQRDHVAVFIVRVELALTTLLTLLESANEPLCCACLQIV